MAAAVLKIFPLGDACAQPRRYLGFWDPLYISGTNWERKLKFGMLIDMQRSFNIDENFLHYVALCF